MQAMMLLCHHCLQIFRIAVSFDLSLGENKSAVLPRLYLFTCKAKQPLCGELEHNFAHDEGFKPNAHQQLSWHRDFVMC